VSAPVAQGWLMGALMAAPFTEAAHVMWLGALGNALESLHDPACARLLGPLVPGATMAGGARVAGTSYDLDPAQAAFCTSLLLQWTPGGRTPLRLAERPEQILGALLAVADYRSRRALSMGDAPWTVAQLTALVSKMDALRGDLMAAVERSQPSHPQPSLAGLRAACVLGTALLCDADENRCRDSLQLAGGVADLPAWAPHGPRQSVILAEAAGQGVRLGLLALRAGDTLHDACDSGEAASLAVPCRLEVVEEWPAVEPELAQSALQRFESAVTQHYPVAQAERIKLALRDRQRLAGLGVHELLALLVRN
jgi:2-methylcitrate dehydratase